MYLSAIVLDNFRSCRSTQVRLSPFITVLVGENGSGKSAIIDALRLTVFPASGKRLYYWDEARDLSKTALAGTQISVTQTYSDLTDYEKSAYIEKLTDESEELVYTTQYDPRPHIPYLNRVRRFIGTARVADPDPSSIQRIGCIYLQPLRDASKEFETFDTSRLAEIMRSIATDRETTEFMDIGADALKRLRDSSIARRAVESIQEHLTRVTHPTRHQELHVGIREADIGRLSRYLRLHMGEFGFDPGDLSSVGLGYANLLYIATVILQLEKSYERDLTLVLVEEPEAHIHPQIQLVLLAYLEARARSSVNSDLINRPAGRIQVLVTTHSPNIASEVSVSNVVVVTTVQSRADPGTPAHRETKCYALSERFKAEKERRKVDRYLSVTRSSLLFARKVILVEGISESILVKVIANQCLFNPKVHDDAEAHTLEVKRQAFSAVSIIPIDGVDFRPYLDLLLGEAHYLVDSVVVVTDNDQGQGIRRRESYEQAFPEAVADGTLVVQVGNATLEADILAETANEQRMKTCYLALHGGSGSKWDQIVENAPSTLAERANYFARSMKSAVAAERLDFDKGEFAQMLSESLESDPRNFSVPGYLEAGLAALV